MSPAENASTAVPSPSEYILDNFDATDRIAMLVLNREFGEKLLAQLTDVPTLAGPTPRQLQSGLVQIEPTKERRE